MSFFGRLSTAAQAALEAWNGVPRTPIPENLFYSGLRDADRERVERYKKFWNYYHGRHKKHLKRKINQVDDNVIVNHSRRIVDKGVSFLFGKPVEWSMSEDSEERAAEIVAEFWKVNRRGTFLLNTALNGGVCGTFYLLMVPSGNLVEPPRIYNLPPQIVFPRWDPDDMDNVLEWELRWRARGVLMRERFVNQNEYWDIVLEEMVRENVWELREEQIWEYDWAPIFHGKNLPNPSEFYGLSDLEDADMNDAVNRNSSNINKILRLYAHPKVWGKGFKVEQLDVSSDEAILTDNIDALLQQLELQSDLSASQGYLRRLEQAYYMITRVPEMDPETMRLGAQSGFALKVLYGDLMEKTEAKRLLYGEVLEMIDMRVQQLMGIMEPAETTLTWTDPLPEDILAEVQHDQFELDERLVSKQTISTKRGYDWEAEQERIQDERRELSEESQSQLLAGLGRSLGM